MIKTTPVKLPAGRFRLATRPSDIGSFPVTKTIGIVVAAVLAASAPGLLATMTAAFRPTRSARRVGSRSSCPSAQRCSSTTFCPSTNPTSFNPRRSAIMTFGKGAEGVLRSKPTTGIIACCARATSGHDAAVPPSSVMSSRRFTQSPRRRGRARVGGTSRPSALAVFRLMTSSYLVGACTGRSAASRP